MWLSDTSVRRPVLATVMHLLLIAFGAVSYRRLQVRADPDTYRTHRRPPMLKDYCDPSLVDVFDAYRRLREVTVRFEIEENSIPAL